MAFQRGFISGLMILLAEKAAREGILGEIVTLLATSVPLQPSLQYVETEPFNLPRHPNKIGPYAFTDSPHQKRYDVKYHQQRRGLKADREKRR